MPASPLSKLIELRKSTRAFLPKSIPPDFVSALAISAYGLRGIAELRDGTRYQRRSVPSAGGMFPLEFFLFVQRVEGLRNGLYHYDVRGPALESIQERDIVADLEPVFCSFKRPISSLRWRRCYRVTKKIRSPCGYRYTLLEAGHAGQNICLAAAELGLSSLCMGGFIDSKLNHVLDLRLDEEGVVYSVAVGWDAQAPG